MGAAAISAVLQLLQQPHLDGSGGRLAVDGGYRSIMTAKFRIKVAACKNKPSSVNNFNENAQQLLLQSAPPLRGRRLMKANQPLH